MNCLILDEPTLGLDIVTSRTILGFISEAKTRGHCVIFSTHYMTEAELLCDRIGFIYGGRLLAIGTKDSLYEQTGTHNLQDAFLSMIEKESDLILSRDCARKDLFSLLIELATRSVGR